MGIYRNLLNSVGGIASVAFLVDTASGKGGDRWLGFALEKVSEFGFGFSTTIAISANSSAFTHSHCLCRKFPRGQTSNARGLSNGQGPTRRYF